MSKAETILKKRLLNILKAQAMYIKSDKTINDNQKMEQMMFIEMMVDFVKNKSISNLNTHEYYVGRALTQDEMDRIEREDMGYNGRINEEGRD